ncbi:MAG TPA: GNAT family N-acetyltransferase [Acidimicrobiales bacterium]|nr:GNAT family N-acetyltransferase [Acidimicrobiales bacterium]
MEQVRSAGVEDLPRLGALAAMAVAELGRHRGAPQLIGAWADADLTGALGAALDDPTASVWAGCVDDVILGVAVGRIGAVVGGGPEPRPQETGAPIGSAPVGRVELIYVEPEARGVGLGEAMLDALVGWFSEQGCSAVDAVALPGVREAKQFFEEAGLVARLIVMHRKLP